MKKKKKMKRSEKKRGEGKRARIRNVKEERKTKGEEE